MKEIRQKIRVLDRVKGRLVPRGGCAHHGKRTRSVLATAAQCKGAVEGKGMEFSAQRADTGITFMPKAPAVVVLRNASLMFGRSEGETVVAIHK